MSVAADFVPNRALRRYILADERVVVATHRHWARLWEPILTTSAAFVLALAILVNVDPGVRDSMGWVWLPFLVLGARLLWKWLEWRSEWFVMTDRRLLLLDGFLVHRVAMMPSEKVTDLGYERTPVGQVLGYGTFIFETAGQDQALDRVAWMPRPDARYRLIIATLFHPDAAEAEAAAQAGTSRRPIVVPPAEPAPTAAPPALMPRIGRRSNPPTQRIELPLRREGADGGTGAAAEATTGSGAPVAEPGSPSGGTGSGMTGTGAPGAGAADGSAHRAAAGWPSLGGAALGSPAAPGGAATSTPAAPADEPPTPRTRPSDGGQGGHVPGGPTATVDDDELRPKPFIEGNDPKLP